MTRKQVAVVDEESATKPGDRIKVLRRFRTVSEAESFIGTLPDKAKVLRGGYGIDCPEEMVNPNPGKGR